MNVRTLSDGHGFLEAPRWHDGMLYVSDFFARAVFAFDENGNKCVVCEVVGQPSGLGWTPAGDLLVVSMLDRKLLRLTGDDLIEVADLSGIATWHANDMVVDASGRSFIGNFGWDESSDDRIVPTALIRVDPDGTVAVAAEDVVFPNGMAITPDGRTLLVAETFAARISAFDIRPGGELTNRRIWAHFADGREFDSVAEVVQSGAVLPDGIALTPQGDLWVADAARQGVVRVSPGGEIQQRISLGEQTAFAVALGGQRGDRLFMCAGPRYGTGNPQARWQSRLLSADATTP